MMAVAAGGALALFHLRTWGDGRRPPVWAGVLHGLVGATGLGLVAWLLGGPPRGLRSGTAGFGMVSAVLLAAALCVGLTIPATRRRRGLSATIIGIHAGLAITGFVVFLAWASFD
ncbi:MAG: hypothetical protein AB7O80_19080 [Acetobacteraceae bacterium]